MSLDYSHTVSRSLALSFFLSLHPYLPLAFSVDFKSAECDFDVIVGYNETIWIDEMEIHYTMQQQQQQQKVVTLTTEVSEK